MYVSDCVSVVFVWSCCRSHHPTRSEPASKASMFNLSRKEGEVCVASATVPSVCI